MTSTDSSTFEYIKNTFFHKYNAKTIHDFHFDNSFIEIIQSLLQLERIHLLFVGNTDTCKTTFLYALLREYYNVAPNDSLPVKNIMFINNLKEQGINYYRNEMKMFCQSYTTISGKKKMVVIDDIDSINEYNQQVFRNCIDKYGHNVHFIVFCSNVRKIIESIQSRLQIIAIPVFKQEYMENIINKITLQENIILDTEAKKFILTISNFSIRVIINYLEKIAIIYHEQIQQGNTITIEMCHSLCTDVSFHIFQEYTESIKRGDVNHANEIIYSIHDYGYSVIDILDNYFTFIKITDILTETEKYKIIPYFCKYITTFHNIHEDSIELAFFTNNISILLTSNNGDNNLPFTI